MNPGANGVDHAICRTVLLFDCMVKKPVCKADRYLESLLAGKVPFWPDRKRVLSDQAFHIRRFFPRMQP